MTCIVGLIDRVNQCVVIGGDSAGIEEYNIVPRKDSKVFRVGDFIIGCTESFRMIQLLRFSLSLPKVYDTDIYEYMCTSFINSVRECFKEGGYIQTYIGGDDKGGTFIVGYKNRLFTIYDDFQVEENLRNYTAIGCGSNYALGALYTILNNKTEGNVETIINLALEAAVEHSSGVCKPFNLLSTKENND